MTDPLRERAEALASRIHTPGPRNLPIADVADTIAAFARDEIRRELMELKGEFPAFLRSMVSRDQIRDAFDRRLAALGEPQEGKP